MTNVDIIKKIFGKKAYFVTDSTPESVYFKYPVTVGGMWAPGDGMFNGFEPDEKIKFRSCNIGLSNLGSSQPYHLAVAVHEAMHAVLFLKTGREEDNKVEAEVNNMAQKWITMNITEPTKSEMLKALNVSRKSYGIKVESFQQFFTEAVSPIPNWKEQQQIPHPCDYLYRPEDNHKSRTVVLPAPIVKSKGKSYQVVNPKTFKLTKATWPYGNQVWGSMWMTPDSVLLCSVDHGPTLNEIYRVKLFGFDTDFAGVMKFGWVRITIEWTTPIIWALSSKLSHAQKAALEHLAIQNEYTFKWAYADDKKAKVIYTPPAH